MYKKDSFFVNAYSILIDLLETEIYKLLFQI